ncbi:MAG: type II secretion system F family protein, partial [Candidatus Omnitrophica bacterium]|nr:type II secretion system F family protein [Candidatus Omnitrophota bacterium]
MPTFHYRAKKGLDETLEGKVDAENQEDAVNRLIALELFPVSIEEVKVSRPSRPSLGRSTFRSMVILKGIRKKVSLKELVAFTQKLATLTKSRVELLNSLKILYEQTEDSRLKEIILELYTLVKEGKTFSDALKGFPGIFPPLYGSLVAAGEASGNL